jgi:hypothetical protein
LSASIEITASPTQNTDRERCSIDKTFLLTEYREHHRAISAVVNLHRIKSFCLLLVNSHCCPSQPNPIQRTTHQSSDKLSFMLRNDGAHISSHLLFFKFGHYCTFYLTMSVKRHEGNADIGRDSAQLKTHTLFCDTARQEVGQTWNVQWATKYLMEYYTVLVN